MSINFQKYGFLYDLTNDQINELNDVIEFKCSECDDICRSKVSSLIKRYNQDIRSFVCHSCSKIGGTKINIKSLFGLINKSKTIEKFSHLPINMKKDFIVIRCEDCLNEFDVKASSALHQARRHWQNGRNNLYKCFSCGIKRPDALIKASEARSKQLKNGFISSLERAVMNRLDNLGLKYEHQQKVGIYSWDFLLIDYDVLIDVDGEYWHSLKSNEDTRKSKKTYTSKYYPKYRYFFLEEKYLLNPISVDKLIIKWIGEEKTPVYIDFSFNDLVVKPIDHTSMKEFLNSYHYAGAGRGSQARYGAFIGEMLVAVCKFASVVRKEVATSTGYKCKEVFELDRFCINPIYQKKNLASWFISKCVNLVFNEFSDLKGLVSFADSTFGHSGTIYKASNWIEVGKTRPSYHYMNEFGDVINKKRVYDIASKLKMKEQEYVKKHHLEKFNERPKTKYVIIRQT